MKGSAVILSLFYIQLLFSQINEDQLEYGNYPIKNYNQEDYRAHYQNWFITTDKKGFVYAANGDGVLEYDGSSWRLISSPGLNAVRTVVADDDNVKWVGGDRELGYLMPDSIGQLQFKSIKDKIPESNPLTANIWQIFPENDRIVFASDNTFYAWQNQRFSIIAHPGPGPVYREYQIHGKIYVNIAGEGMFQVAGDSMRLIPGGDLFKTIKATVAIPFGNKKVLFAGKGSGLYIFDGLSIHKFENEIDTYLNENLLYAGTKLNDSIYVFATLRGGIISMDKNGKRIGTITEEDGLGNNQIHGLTVDQQHRLWLAHQTGISTVEPLLPYTIFDERNGLEGTVSNIVRHAGKLYVGTFNGLFVLNGNDGSHTAKFEKIAGIKSGCFSLLRVGDELFAATAEGVFVISGQEVTQINSLLGSRSLCRSKRNENRIFVGHMHGLSTIIKKEGKWKAEKNFNQVKEDIFSVNTTDNGHLILGTSLHEVLKIDLPDDNMLGQNDEYNDILIYRFSKGLPKGPVNVWLLDGEIFATTNGEGGPLFKLDVDTNGFIPDSGFGHRFGLDSLTVYPIAGQNHGQYVLLESTATDGNRYRFSAKRSENGGYAVKRLYDEPVRSKTQTKLFWDSQNYLWIGGENLIKYDLNSKYNFRQPFVAHVRNVTIGQDSVIYAGQPLPGFHAILNHSNTGIRFEFAAPTLYSEQNAYQYRIEGMEPTWSEWSKENRKDYTNLPSGNFTFLVRAKNIYGDISDVGTFDFEILTPWYLAWWSKLLYVLLFISLIWVLIAWRSRKLKAKNLALEKLIAIRTAKVEEQSGQLKRQAEKLRELDKAKSRFFANISHEFRTPLTLIKGPIEQLEGNFTKRLDYDTVKMIRRNTNRLLNMVNQLLDLSKIDEGSLKLSPTEGDVFKSLRAATASFNSQAAQRNMDYRVEIPNSVYWASFDRDKLENIIYNLLGNAFKFSDNGAIISFSINTTASGLQIKVFNSGNGIAPDKLPHIFDRFYQGDNSGTRKAGGSGIGLSLSKDLVELMNGNITVASSEGLGTTFTVNLPIQEIMTKSKTKLGNTATQKEREKTAASFEFSKMDKRNIPNILLVEDNLDMRHFIRGQLVEFYQVTEALNGEIGFQKALTDPPDLVITDLMMPKMDGIELCKMLKTDVNTSHIPIIMLTAKAGIDNKIEGLETGADDYLTKPFNGKELLVRVKNLIVQREKLRELFSDKAKTINPKSVTVTSIDQKFLENVLDLLEEKHPQSDFGVRQMQAHLGMSKTQLHRKLKALTNESPGELLRNYRLKKAGQLIAQHADSVTQIAYMVGFNNLSYFSKCFKDFFGVSPSSYRS